MQKMSKQVDWSVPQRQPVEGLLVVVIKTFWEVMKRAWPFLLLMLFRGEAGWDRYEIITIGIAAIALLSGVMSFFFFKFYIINNELTIKKGWLKKGTHVVPLNRIHSVHIEQSIFHSILGIVKLSVDTAGSEKSEITIDALHRSMADELRMTLLNKEAKEETTEEKQDILPIVKLTTSDLLKLSISANHIEALLIFISFGFGIIENIRQVNQEFIDETTAQLPAGTPMVVAFMFILVMVITILVSTAGIFLRYFNFTVSQTSSGFHIRTGLFTVKERVVSLKRIQYISWKANWIRKLMKLWILEYHVAGGDERSKLMKAKVPVSIPDTLGILTAQYHPIPSEVITESLLVHSSYVWRRFVLTGLLPFAIIIPAVWIYWEASALILLLIPTYILIAAIQFRKKFRLWAYDDVLFIRRGIFGEERILLQWHNLQTVTITQSPFQRRKELANLRFYTAAGIVKVPFIDLQNARMLLDFSIYKIESSKKSWM